MKQSLPNIAKITKPSLSRVFSRERLFCLLDENNAKPVTWISGPPGCGKTTLIASYIDSRKLSSLWYQIDESDEDIASFFYHMGLAARKAAPRRRKPFPLFTPEYLPGLPTFIHCFFQELYSRLKTPFFIVLDNCQKVQRESQLHDVIAQGLAVIPEGGRIVLISRDDPPTALARLRANGRMSIINRNDMKLTEDELKGILQLQNKKEVPAERVRELNQKMEGWAAGVILMLEHMETGEFMPETGGKLAPESIFDYFAGEVFLKTDHQTQNLLLKTAFLPGITITMAEELTGLSGAGIILASLCRKNYFTVKHHRPVPVYQYHPLFKDFLLSRARETLKPEQLVHIQQKAAKLLEKSGQIGEAIELLMEAGNLKVAVATIIKHAPALLDQGRGQTLEHWLKDLPDEMLQTTPYLLYYLAICRLPFAPSESRIIFAKAFERFQQAGDEVGLLLACSGTIDAFLYEVEDLRPLDIWIERLERLLQSDTVFPATDIETRVRSSMFMSLVVRQPQHSKIESLAKQLMAVSQKVPDVNLRMLSELDVAIYYLWKGDFTSACVVMESMRKLARSPQASPLSLTTLKNVEAMYYMFTGRSEPCLEAGFNGLAIAEETGVHIWTYLIMSHCVAGALCEGDLDRSGELLKEMASHSAEARRMDNILFYHYTAWEALLKHKVLHALHHQEIALRLAREVGSPYLEGLCHFGMAQVLFEQGIYKKARSHLARTQQIARRMRSHILEFMCLLTRAYFALEKGSEQDGLKTLKEAMILGKEQGYTHFLGWHPDFMARLCVKAMKEEIETKYVQNLIIKRNLIPDTPPVDCENWPWPLKIFTMGRFSIVIDGVQKRFSGKAQKRPLEMLKAIIAFGGRDVGEEMLTDVLWPEADGDAAHQAFATTLHRLRRLLGVGKAIQLHESKITLNPHFCWVDIWAFERMLGEIEAALSERETDKAGKEIGRLVDKVLKCCQGAFLKNDVNLQWAVSCRERLRDKFLRVIALLGPYLCQIKECDRAIACYRKGLDLDNLAENLYIGLMKCYECLGRRTEAIAAYHSCRRNLSTYLGIQPSREIQSLYRSLTNR